MPRLLVLHRSHSSMDSKANQGSTVTNPVSTGNSSPVNTASNSLVNMASNSLDSTVNSNPVNTANSRTPISAAPCLRSSMGTNPRNTVHRRVLLRLKVVEAKHRARSICCLCFSNVCRM